MNNIMVTNGDISNTRDNEDFSTIVNINQLAETKFVNLYDTEYADGSHYYTASRRKKDNLKMLYPDEPTLPDAVSMFVIVIDSVFAQKGYMNLYQGIDKSCKLFLQKEFRHPMGSWGYSVPAGLIDKNDLAIPGMTRNEILIHTAKRELREETGIDVDKQNYHFEYVLNPDAASSPGFTDESNGIVCMICSAIGSSVLSHDENEGSEHIGDYIFMDKSRANELLQDTSTPKSLMVTTDLLWFVAEQWKYQFR